MVSEEFILGMMAGEGSFHVVLEPPSEEHIGRERPKFVMTMYEDEILRDMCLELGLGSVQKDNDLRYSWHIQSKQEVAELKEWVEENATEDFKKTKKYEQFLLWSEAVELVPQGRQPLSKEKRKRLVEISYEIPISNTKNKTKEEWFSLIDSTEVHYCNEETKNGSKCKNRVPSKNDTCRHH